MKDIRRAAVAGMFYPAGTVELKNVIQTLLNNAELNDTFENLYGVVSPHAGYVYSGLSAAYSYNALKSQEFETAVIISPSHREYFQGLSIFEGNAYETPLGMVEIDEELRKQLVGGGKYFFEGWEGHRAEHAVEVQIPFLQMIKKEFKILPIVIGDQRKLFVDHLAEGLAGIERDNVVIIISSDLSHFYTKNIAYKMDSIVADRISNMQFDELQQDLEQSNCEACGGGGIVAMLKAAHMKNFSLSKVLSRTDSGDTSGDNSSVVGYLSAVVYN
jgi:hypothetical protein